MKNMGNKYKRVKMWKLNRKKIEIWKLYKIKEWSFENLKIKCKIKYGNMKGWKSENYGN